TAVVAIGCVALLAAPAVAATPEHDIAFPSDWTVEVVDEPLAKGQARVVLRAHPGERTEECHLADLGPIAAALHDLGVSDEQALNYVASDLLGHGGSFARISGRGYSDPWSMYMEGTLDDGAAFALYSFLGRDAWAGLEDAWLALECWSDAQFHQDWEQIAKTFGYAMPAAVSESTGPLVFGGRIELPSVGLSLEVPESWVAADLTDPDLAEALASGGKAGEWLATQLEHSIGDTIDRKAEADQELVLWTWAADSTSGWPEHCEIELKASAWRSSAEMAESVSAYVADGEKAGDDQEWSLVELTAGEAARHDYDWTPTSGGTTYRFVEPRRQVTLSCQDYDFGDDADVAAKRHRWETIAETLQPLP
ncbi:MAG: hypothetical protein U9O18_06420, partial [Chloroflexota bacterium]|nr:hypothetical protein [Chloroflexota bacterium]